MSDNSSSQPTVAKSGSHGGIRVSFEFFPPRNDQMTEKLWDCIRRLEPLDPDFVSVTYGAGGSTRERTHETVSRLVKETSLIPAAHLTCVDASRAEVDTVIQGYKDAGVKHIVALRGDSPEGVGEPYKPHPDGYENAADLVRGISRVGGFEISVSAYPEKHPESPNFAVDLDNLKAKVEAGATRAITQFFFVNDYYFRYVDRVAAHGIDVPVVAGILPVLNFRQAANFASRCGAHIPPWLADRFDGLDDDPETRRLIATAVAAEQVLDLMQRGVTEFHFYTMNNANIVFAICHLMGIRPKRAEDRRLAG